MPLDLAFQTLKNYLNGETGKVLMTVLKNALVISKKKQLMKYRTKYVFSR
jgi:hypothetical protein